MNDSWIFEPWVVYDGWHYWRARVTECTSPILRRRGFRFVREQKFASFSWEQKTSSQWFKNEEDCERAARLWLNSIVRDGGLVS